MDIKGKNVLVIGAAVTGMPVVIELLKLGANIILNDFKKEDELGDIVDQLHKLNVRTIFGGHPIELANECDFIVISPGVPTDIPLVEKAKSLNKKVISEIELAYGLTDTPIAAITGTNGKTTTTALLGEIMKASGRKTFITGNIGHPMISEVCNSNIDDVFVLEVSSFQLESTEEFKPKVSALLNITPDHLNRHKTMENYIEAKSRVFINQDKDDFTILNKDDDLTSKLINKPKSKVLLFSRIEEIKQGAFVKDNAIYIRVDDKEEFIINIDDIYIPGKHNLENALAASLIAYCLGVTPEIIARILSEFKGVEHRIEFVEELNEVIYYNDSKGTNIDASIKAVEAMKRPIILIAGGMDKGSEFDEFVKTFKDKVKFLILLGETADKIERTAREYNFSNTHKVKSLGEAVKKSYEIAEPGDCVLLSPACASWDMFNNYEERGTFFKKFVSGLRRG